jgi:N-carbamoyl-L-amino-acid hydrolase
MASLSEVLPDQVLSDLHELDAQTGGEGGARRVAWTPEWERARAQFTERVVGLGLTAERDRAGNIWVELQGESDSTVVLGSHLDSVPAGGWLDGALGVWAGLAVLEGLLRDKRRPSRSVAVVDWADEEGARFGRSLYGSAAFVGALEVDEFAGLVDRDGQSAADVLRAAGISLDSLDGADPRLDRIAAYLELHIEQGPVLVEAGDSVASVTGTVGIKRDCFSFQGQSAHAGPTPMEGRADAFLPAAEVVVALEELARRYGGRATTGRLDLEPGVPTATAGHADLFTDLRHEDAEILEQMHAEAGRIAEARATSRGIGVTRRKIWAIEPRAFDPQLVTAARQACVAAGGSDISMPSGALHDAAELAPLVPTAMIFCASQQGLSHCPEEDSTKEDLECAIRAFDLLARSVADPPDSSNER